MAHGFRNLVGIVAAVIVLGAVVDPDGDDSKAVAEPPASTAVFVKPVDGRFTSGFGARWGEQHGGIDIAAPLGTPIRAVTAGTVLEAGPASGFGYWVRLEHPDGTVTVYGHMRVITRPEGARVKAGQVIAKVGSEGESTGPHCHFEVWPHGQRAKRVDPQRWLADRGVRY